MTGQGFPLRNRALSDKQVCSTREFCFASCLPINTLTKHASLLFIQHRYPLRFPRIPFSLSSFYNFTMERMASVSNGIGLSSSIVSLLSFTIESCTALNRNIKSFKTKNRTVRELRGEGQDLESVLRTLEDSMNNVAVSMEFLKQPLNRCRDACKDFNALLTEFTEHPTDEEVSVGNWLKLRYMGEDIAGFKNMLAGYKSTITIALVYVNMYKLSTSFPTPLTCL
jgi:hypothetical protein